MDNLTCSIDGCEKPVVARSLCKACYYRERRREKYAEDPDLCVECGTAIPLRKGARVLCGAKPCELRNMRRRRGNQPDTLVVECARPGCNTQFLQTRSGHKMCSHACRYMSAYARWSEDPSWRASHNARGNRWFAQNDEARRAKVARRRARLIGATTFPVTGEGLRSRFIAAGGKCWMCGDVADTWDHVKPLIAGGPHMLANLRPACRPCNSSKGGKWPNLKLADAT